MQADDDTWFTMDLLAEQLRRQPRSRFYFGNIYTNNPRFKNPNDQWYEPNYFSDHYPSYATGGTGYVLSGDLAAWIARNKDDMVVFTGNEDAMVGTWCAAHRGVPAKHDGRFIQLYGSDQCMALPLGVHLGPYPVKWPHGTIAATMREYLANYRLTGRQSVCGERRKDEAQRMISMRDKGKDIGDEWYRFASFASGKCLGVRGKSHIEWQDCSQYAQWQRWQQFVLQTRVGKKGRPRYTMESRMKPGFCIGHDVKMPRAKQARVTEGSMTLTPCAKTNSATWHQIPDTTGLPGVLAIGKHHKLCVSKHPSGSGGPRLEPCQGAQ